MHVLICASSRRAGTGRQACLNTSLPVTTRNTIRPSKLNTTLGTICSPTGKAGLNHATAGASNHPPHHLRPLVAGGVCAPSAPVLPLPRRVLSRDRGYLDKFVELLVGSTGTDLVLSINIICVVGRRWSIQQICPYMQAVSVT